MNVLLPISIEFPWQYILNNHCLCCSIDIPSAQILSTSNSKVICGSDTRFDCRVSGCPLPDKVEWQKSPDGTTFNHVDIYERKYFGSSTDPRSPFLLLRQTTFNDQQYYQAVVWNLMGKCTSNKYFLQITGGILVYFFNYWLLFKNNCCFKNHSEF